MYTKDSLLLYYHPLKTLSHCILRPNLTLHVFGSGGCGKKSLKRQWFDGSHSPVLSEIADVHIRIQVNHSVDDCGVCLFVSALY